MPATQDNDPDVEFVRAFLNTVDADDGTDDLTTTGRFAAWLRTRGAISLADEVTPADLALARELRTGLRAKATWNHGGERDPAVLRRLDDLAEQLPLRVTFDDAGNPSVAAARDGVKGVMAAVLASVASLAKSGDWSRVKICPADDCQWTFFDRSRNRSRRWCSMRVCGNRHKIRAYRERSEP